MNKTTEERFLSHVKKLENGCWKWIASHFHNGYGAFKFNRKIEKAHRFSYEYYIGKIPEKMLACHSCDNTWCVNPNHIFIGTQTDNMQDCKKKGRNTKGISLNKKK